LVRKRLKRKRLSRIALLPTLLTLGNLLCGFAAVHFAAKHLADAAVVTSGHARLEQWLPTNLAIAAYLVFAAMAFDALDGAVARLTRRTSDFGGQLDSLADVVSFGVAPAMLLVAIISKALAGEQVVTPISDQLSGRAVWIIAAIYVSCAALRLARFNVENVHDVSAHLSFKGLPSPGAGGALAALVILHEDVLQRSRWIWLPTDLASQLLLWSLPAVTLGLALLMVSRVRYVHAVNRYLRGRRSWGYVVRAMFVVGAFVVYPQLVLAGLLVAYGFSGPVAAVWRSWGPREPAGIGEAASAEAAQSQADVSRGEAVEGAARGGANR